MPDNQNIKKEVLQGLSTRLTEFGFKLKGVTFMRETEPGLYQIIDIVLGQSTSITRDHIGLGFGIATEE